MTGKLKKVSTEILGLGLKTGEARASPASPLRTALYISIYQSVLLVSVELIDFLLDNDLAPHLHP